MSDVGTSYSLRPRATARESTGSSAGQRGDPSGSSARPRPPVRLELRADRAARVLLAVDVYVVTVRIGAIALITVALAGTQPLVRNLLPVDNGTTILPDFPSGAM